MIRSFIAIDYLKPSIPSGNEWIAFLDRKSLLPQEFFRSSCERKAFFIRSYKETKISAPLVLIHRRSRRDRTSNSAATSSAYPAGLKIPARRK